MSATLRAKWSPVASAGSAGPASLPCAFIDTLVPPPATALEDEDASLLRDELLLAARAADGAPDEDADGPADALAASIVHVQAPTVRC